MNRKVQTLLTLKKAIKVLDYLASKEHAQGVREIARQLDINVSTVSHILFTLNSFGYVKQDDTQKYSLGIRLFELGNLFFKRLKLEDTVVPLMTELMLKTRETVQLSTYDLGEKLCLAILKSPRPVATVAFMGRRELLHKSAAGKAILAYLPVEEVDRIIKEKGLPRYTANTITSPEQLKQELKKIRERGFAIDLGEGEEEVRCVAACVFNHEERPIGAISISVPAYRFNSEGCKELGELVRKTCEEASRLLGYNPGNR